MSIENIENKIKEENKEKLGLYFLRDQFWLPNKDDLDERFWRSDRGSYPSNRGCS